MPTSARSASARLVSTVTRDEQRRRPPAPRRVDRRPRAPPHHRAPPPGVDVEHPDAEPRRRGAGLRDGIGNVVELEVEEDAEAALDIQRTGSGPGDDEQLLADLQRAVRRDRGDRRAPSARSGLAKSSATMTRGARLLMVMRSCARCSAHGDHT